MPSVPDTANLPPWLIPKREPWEALVAGVQAGSAIASNRLRAQQMIMEAEQNYRREETATQLKMLDLGLESDRNDIALKTLLFKREADKFATEGMFQLTGQVGNAVKNEKLLDPETQADFWRTAGKYNVKHEVSNSVWDNTYGNAMRMKAQADRALSGGADTSAKLEQQGVIDKMEMEIASLEEESNALGWTPESKAEVDAKKKRLDRFRASTGFVTPDESRQMAIVDVRAAIAEEEAAKRRMHEEKMATGRATSTEKLREESDKRRAGLVKVKADIKAISEKYAPQLLPVQFSSNPDDIAKREKLVAAQDKETEAIWAKYYDSFENDGVGKGGAPAPASTNAPAFRFDPIARKRIPIK